MSLYLQDVSQQPEQDLVLAVAQEAVCVQRVLVAVETQLHHVALVFYFLLGGKRYLRGRPPEIKRTHRGPAGAEPVAHEAIL